MLTEIIADGQKELVYENDAQTPRIDAGAANAQNGQNQPDMVNHPPHYTQGGVECIEAIRAACEGRDGYEGYLTGQVMKYIWRYPYKNGLEDLKKAEFYLHRLIQKKTLEEVDGYVRR